MKKDTSKILEELRLCEDFKNFYNENQPSMVSGSLSEALNDLLSKKGLRKSQVIRDSELSEIYAYQIFSGVRRPDRKKLLCLAVAMHTTPDEAQTLLKHGGYPPLYAKTPFDSVIIYGMYKGLSVVEINEILFEHNLETLG